MSYYTKVIDKPIDPSSFQFNDHSTNSGAVVEFFGVVRGDEDEQKISGIEYEAFREMAEHQLNILAKKYVRLHDLNQLVCIHRIGFVAVREASLFVRVASAHRAEAFSAMMEFIDELKRVVPIWKYAISVA